MTAEEPQDITALLTAWNNGDEKALDSLMPRVYPELRRIARQHLSRRQPGHTLESAALANEAYLKLTRAGGIGCGSRAHFLALCSQIIRRILVDHTRSRAYAKRGGSTVRIPLEEGAIAAKAPRTRRAVELPNFGGLSVEETAEVLGISPETAKRDWKLAKAWLFGELTAEKDPAKR